MIKVDEPSSRLASLRTSAYTHSQVDLQVNSKTASSHHITHLLPNRHSDYCTTESLRYTYN
ncbi:uncharacterized protein MYCFIDRAFT_179700 [Pseudocercospora fijiensis CIRAD86]|uniref:Uncharacterized protein n=1 Tax=Pseudocercospora fijiensis (strain CIRAD86) TaxID=383855 RepID=M2ZZ98_PSEFD|nr:uncharacterized protein MYCFIDRAFT_179700 [Pseudocercospora fijiensis CIRAD86]EME77486.1 hypothetical protein MYCFIDRAFT_179700 [Pseudocercospora fijiensis CIRAD86]